MPESYNIGAIKLAGYPGDGPDYLEAVGYPSKHWVSIRLDTPREQSCRRLWRSSTIGGGNRVLQVKQEWWHLGNSDELGVYAAFNRDTFPAAELPFLRVILAGHVDAALVFADWLEERGDQRAERIRRFFKTYYKNPIADSKYIIRYFSRNFINWTDGGFGWGGQWASASAIAARTKLNGPLTHCELQAQADWEAT